MKEARSRLEKLGLGIGQVTEVYDSRKRGNRVLSQKPEPGVPAALGSKVDVVVNQGD
jgi:serine/threonine-protein kinase